MEKNNDRVMIKKYLDKQQFLYQKAGERYSKETNFVFHELSRQMILVATVFLSISAFIFNVDDLAIILESYDKYVLIAGWIFFAVSIIAGISQFFTDYFYFREMARINLDIRDDIYNGDINENNIEERISQKQKEVKRESSTICVYVQITFLLSGIFSFVYIASNILLTLQ